LLGKIEAAQLDVDDFDAVYAKAKELGGSATVSEMNERAMASAAITEEQQAEVVSVLKRASDLVPS